MVWGLLEADRSHGHQPSAPSIAQAAWLVSGAER